MQYETCPWCRLKTEKSDGPVHRYLESSPGCWAKYGELLAREYEDFRYMAVHGLTVDTYALQHPGKESPQTISSANIHLASLYVYFELDKPVKELARFKQKMTLEKGNLHWLEPPQDMTVFTVVDVLHATTAEEHISQVKDGAEYIYGEWRIHHEKIRSFCGS